MLLTLNTKLTFGKYKGITIGHLLIDINNEDQFNIVEKFLEYLNWLDQHVTNHELAEDVRSRMLSCLKHKPKYEYQYNTLKEAYPTNKKHISRTRGISGYWAEDGAHDIFDAHGN